MMVASLFHYKKINTKDYKIKVLNDSNYKKCYCYATNTTAGFCLTGLLILNDSGQAKNCGDCCSRFLHSGCHSKQKALLHWHQRWHKTTKKCCTLYLPLSTFCTGKRDGQMQRRCCWRISSWINSESDTTLDGSPHSRATTLCTREQNSVKKMSTWWQFVQHQSTLSSYADKFRVGDDTWRLTTESCNYTLYTGTKYCEEDGNVCRLVTVILFRKVSTTLSLWPSVWQGMWQKRVFRQLLKTLRRRRRANVRAQALASLPDSLYTFYNIYIYFLILNFTSTSGSL